MTAPNMHIPHRFRFICKQFIKMYMKTVLVDSDIFICPSHTYTQKCILFFYNRKSALYFIPPCTTHTISRIAENRLSFTFLPKVCDLELAELDTGKKGKGSDGVGRGSSSSLVRTESEASHLDEMAAWAPSTIPTSTGVEDENCSDGGASTSYSGTYDVVKIMGNLSSFLLRPLPPDSQMQCIIQRLSPLKVRWSGLM